MCNLLPLAEVRNKNTTFLGHCNSATSATMAQYSLSCETVVTCCVAYIDGNSGNLCRGKGKGKGPVLDIALLHDEHMLRSTLQSRKWQLIGMS